MLDYYIQMLYFKRVSYQMIQKHLVKLYVNYY